MKQRKVVDDSVKEDEQDRGSDEKKEAGWDSESELVEDERIEKVRSHMTTMTSVTVSGVNVVKMSGWLLLMIETRKFIKFNKE